MHNRRMDLVTYHTLQRAEMQIIFGGVESNGCRYFQHRQEIPDHIRRPSVVGNRRRKDKERSRPALSADENAGDHRTARSELIDPDGCHLYLWATNNHLKDAFAVMEAWGFQYVTTITWQKDRAGLGQYYRGMTEHCLFGTTKKRLPYKIVDGKRQQGVTGFLEARREHSQKPERMRQMIETVSYGPMIELFAREQRSGWDAWGLEAQGGVILLLLCPGKELKRSK